jgi:hypothetical protein
MLCAGLGDVLLRPGCARDRNIAFAGLRTVSPELRPGRAISEDKPSLFRLFEQVLSIRCLGSRTAL